MNEWQVSGAAARSVNGRKWVSLARLLGGGSRPGPVVQINHRERPLLTEAAVGTTESEPQLCAAGAVDQQPIGTVR